MKLKIVLLFIITFSIIMFAGCKEKMCAQDPKDCLFKINDVEFSQMPNRIIVLSDSIADVILATSNEIKLIGRSSICTQKELNVLPDVGSNVTPDIDKIINLSPDLILTDSILSTDILDNLSAQKIKVLTLPLAKTKAELEALYSSIGYIFGGIDGQEKASAVCEKIFEHIDDISRIKPTNNIYITACYMYDENGSVATGDTFAGQLINYAGAVNIAHDSIDNIMTINGIKLSDPNYIFCPPELIDAILNNENYKSISAVSQGHVYPLENSSVLRQGKTMLETVKYIYETIYN